MGDRSYFSDNNDKLVVYNIINDDCQILSDKENYKTLNVETFNHCILQNICNPNQYISFDKTHVVVYDHSRKQTFDVKLINKTDIEFPPGGAVCVQLDEDSLVTHIHMTTIIEKKLFWLNFFWTLYFICFVL